MTTKYVVLEGHTLGVLRPGTEPAYDTLEPLGRSVDGHAWQDGPVAVYGSSIRPATRADFDKFRVSVPPDWAEPQGEQS